MEILKFENGSRGDAVARLKGGKICLSRRGGPTPRAGETWLASHIEQRDRSAVAHLRWRLDQVPGTWSEADASGLRHWVITDSEAAAALKAAGIKAQPAPTADFTVNGQVYRTRAQRTLASEDEFILSADGTVIEAEYACTNGFAGALVVLPRAKNAAPRGAVAVKPGDVIVRRHFARGLVTAFQVTGFGQRSAVGCYNSDWPEPRSLPVITGKRIEIPSELPDWVAPSGFCLVWDEKPQASGVLFGRCNNGAVVALKESGYPSVSGFACSDMYAGYGKLSDAQAVEAWAELSDPEVSPWMRHEDGWVRRSGDIIIACVRPHPTRGHEVWGPKIPVVDGFAVITEYLILIDEANGGKPSSRSSSFLLTDRAPRALSDPSLNKIVHVII